MIRGGLLPGILLFVFTIMYSNISLSQIVFFHLLPYYSYSMKHLEALVMQNTFKKKAERPKLSPQNQLHVHFTIMKQIDA